MEYRWPACEVARDLKRLPSRGRRILVGWPEIHDFSRRHIKPTSGEDN
jgi:hypothetical protein